VIRNSCLIVHDADTKIRTAKLKYSHCQNVFNAVTDGPSHR